MPDFLLPHTPFERDVCTPLTVSRNETYLTCHDDVLHLSLDLPPADSPSEEMLSERYFPRNKGQRLSQYVLSITPYSDLVHIPAITGSGTIDASPHTISYWREPFISGLTAKALGSEFTATDYAKIIDWICDMQASHNTSDVSVAEYYMARCAAGEDLLRHTSFAERFTDSQRLILCRAIQQTRLLVDDLGLSESCTPIHGDLHAGNVIKSLSDNPDNPPTFTVIDFEFGISGPGDTLNDIQKLLRFDKDLLNEFQGSDCPPIELPDKNMLLKAYVERCPGTSSLTDEATLRKRVLVIMLDAFMTWVIGYESYKDKVGDTFPIPDYELYATHAFSKLSHLCKDAGDALH